MKVLQDPVLSFNFRTTYWTPSKSFFFLIEESFVFSHAMFYSISHLINLFPEIELFSPGLSWVYLDWILHLISWAFLRVALRLCKTVRHIRSKIFISRTAHIRLYQHFLNVDFEFWAFKQSMSSWIFQFQVKGKKFSWVAE